MAAGEGELKLTVRRSSGAASAASESTLDRSRATYITHQDKERMGQDSLVVGAARMAVIRGPHGGSNRCACYS